jgi:hypothetical protein
MNVRYNRSGGPRPPDAECLEIQEDGSFTLRRVIGLNRAGEFGGLLPEAGVEDIRSMAEAASRADSPDVPDFPPHAVLEHLRAGDREWQVPSEWDGEGPVVALIQAMRHLLEELTDEPVAALALAISEDATSASLTVEGDSAVQADFAGATCDYSLFDEDQEFVASGELSVELGHGPEELPPGWSADIPLPGDIEFNEERTLQVRLTFRMKYSDGIWRDAQITAVAGKGWY